MQAAESRASPAGIRLQREHLCLAGLGLCLQNEQEPRGLWKATGGAVAPVTWGGVTSEKLALDIAPAPFVWWREEILAIHLDLGQNVLFLR